MRTFNQSEPAPDRSEPAPEGKPALILASGSPRRQEMMERFFGRHGFTVMKPAYDEAAAVEVWQREADRTEFTDPTGFGERLDELLKLLSSGKMEALASQFSLPESYAAISADTLVIAGSLILGKPADCSDAAGMLRRLSGRTHEVRTGIRLDVRLGGALLRTDAIETTSVTFSDLSEEQVQWYVKTGEPMDKAGAYGIQGYGAALVERIDGCYYNVMGFPVYRLMAMLRQAESHFRSHTRSIHLLPWT